MPNSTCYSQRKRATCTTELSFSNLTPSYHFSPRQQTTARSSKSSLASQTNLSFAPLLHTPHSHMLPQTRDIFNNTLRLHQQRAPHTQKPPINRTLPKWISSLFFWISSHFPLLPLSFSLSLARSLSRTYTRKSPSSTAEPGHLAHFSTKL